jgi:hypothetical protein
MPQKHRMFFYVPVQRTFLPVEDRLVPCKKLSFFK